MSQQSLSDRAVLVLARLATLGEEINNDMPERHMLRHIRSLVTQRLDAAITDAEGLFGLARYAGELVATVEAESSTRREAQP